LAGRRLRPDEESILTLRVWPTDADISVANNTAYLAYFEMARVDLQLRTGFARLAFETGWSAPLASIAVVFKRPLRRFQKFRVTARLAYWDERSLYVEQRLERNGETIAAALARSVILGKEGRIAPAAAISALGYALKSPSPPALIEKLREAETLM
jgi:acyl-CoA thioesterase FadM